MKKNQVGLELLVTQVGFTNLVNWVVAVKKLLEGMVAELKAGKRQRGLGKHKRFVGFSFRLPFEYLLIESLGS